MSASPMARQAVESKAIPIRRVVVDDPSDLPSHLSSTPGGTLFSTTPGGTKIVYERSFLLHLRNSPISKTPPNFSIPDHLSPGGGSPTHHQNPNHNHNRRSSNHSNHPPKSPLGKTPPKDDKKKKSPEHAEDQFQIDL